MNLSNLKKVFSVCDFENKKIIYFLGFKISHKSKINDVSCRLQKIENKFKKFDLSNKYFPDFTISSLEVHIAEHCNLNCQCCNHYSPLAKEEFLDINIFEKDLNRLSQLTNGNISYLKLLGGEPLLCPNLIDYFQTARKYFPNSNIVLMTNAILLNKCDDNFYEALRKYDIEICLTKYPLKIDFKAIEKKFKKEKCKLTQIGINKNDTIKHSWFYPIDLKGEQNINANYYNCYEGGKCNFLRNGKIYPCPIPPNIHHFNRYFNQNIPLDENDSIDIYKAKTIGDIADFLSKPIPFCKYCYVTQRKFDLDWGLSKKEITEWVKFD